MLPRPRRRAKSQESGYPIPPQADCCREEERRGELQNFRRLQLSQFSSEALTDLWSDVSQEGPNLKHAPSGACLINGRPTPVLLQRGCDSRRSSRVCLVGLLSDFRAAWERQRVGSPSLVIHATPDSQPATPTFAKGARLSKCWEAHRSATYRDAAILVETAPKLDCPSLSSVPGANATAPCLGVSQTLSCWPCCMPSVVVLLPVNSSHRFLFCPDIPTYPFYTTHFFAVPCFFSKRCTFFNR